MGRCSPTLPTLAFRPSKKPGHCRVNTRIAQANLITKTDFDAKLSSLNRKITKNKSDHLLVQNELNKLKTFDSTYFIEKVILKKMVLKII